MATLPVTGYVAGGALCAGLVGRHQRNWGRKRGFQLGLMVVAGVNYLGRRVASRRNVTRRLVVVPARFLLLQWSKAVGMWAKVVAVGNAAPRSGALSTVAAGAPPGASSICP